MGAVINPELDRLARARYISLTTFRKDGTPVATPVWLVSEGGYLQVLTKATTGKVKRLRNNSRVTLAPCDARGGLQGDPVDATATIIEDPELVARTEQLIRSRYGVAAALMHLLDRVRRQGDYAVLAIEVPQG